MSNVNEILFRNNNMINIDAIKSMAIEEVIKREFGTTQQYLDVHSIVHEYGKPSIEIVDALSREDTVAVYFPVVGERFFFAVYIRQVQQEARVVATSMEPGSRVYLRAISDEPSLQDLIQGHSPRPTRQWGKGDYWTNQSGIKTRRRYQNSGFDIDLALSNAIDYHEKIKTLMNAIEPYEDWLAEVCRRADVFIETVLYLHFGNGNLTGLYLDRDEIRRMSKLHLSMDFDVYVGGNPLH